MSVEKRLNELAERMTDEQAARFEQSFSDFGAGAELSEEARQRILSSVMRKAGIDMKETMVNEKTRKHGKRFVGFVIAAALLTSGAIGAGAYYMANRNTWNAVKYKFDGSESVLSDEQINNAAETIERITTPVGECEINTFDDLDITYEGTVADQDSMEMMFTIRRKDGQPFEEKNGYQWMIKYSDALYAYENEDTLYHTYAPNGHYELNPDGSLSMALDGFIFYNNAHEDYDYRLGFVDLCYVPEEAFGFGPYESDLYYLAMDAWNAAHKMTGDGTVITLSDDEFVLSYLDTRLNGEEYDEAYADWQENDAAYEKVVRESAEYYYSGELLYRVPAASLKNSVPTYTTEQTGSGFEVTISPQRITLKTKGDHREDRSRYGSSIDVHKMDGSVETLPAPESRGLSDWLDDGTEVKYFTLEAFPDTPIKAEDIAYIQLGDIKINING